MSDHETHDFDTGGAGASAEVPVQAGSIKKGSYAMLKGMPCKVVEYSVSKTGKHGHAKAHIVGLDIFTGKKYEDICPTSHNMSMPVVKRTEYQVIDCDAEGFITLMAQDTGETKSDLRITEPEEVEAIVAQLADGEKTVIATVVSACGNEKVIGRKEGST